MRCAWSEVSIQYKDDQGYNFMNNENFDQVLLQDAMIDSWFSLKERNGCRNPLSCWKWGLPMSVTFAYVYGGSRLYRTGWKGQHSHECSETCQIGNRAEISAAFVNEGDKIKIDTQLKVVYWTGRNLIRMDLKEIQELIKTMGNQPQRIETKARYLS